MLTHPPDEALVRRLLREIEAERERRIWAEFRRFMTACRAYEAAVEVFQAEHRRAFEAGVLGPVDPEREIRSYQFYARVWASRYPHEVTA